MSLRFFIAHLYFYLAHRFRVAQYTYVYIDIAHRLDYHVHCVLLMHVISLMVSRNLYAAANTYKFSVAIRPKVR